MRIYEITYLLKPTLNKESIIEIKERIKTLVTEKGGLLLSEEEPHKVRLGYEIEDFQEGLLGVIRFSAKSEVPALLEDPLKKIPEILRFIVERNRDYEKRLKKTEVTEVLEEKKERVEIDVAELEEKLKEVLGEDESE